MQRVLLVGLYVVTAIGCMGQEVKQSDTADSISVRDSEINSLESLSYSPKLEQQIRRAEAIIELQNSQLAQTNELLSQYWGALGVTLAGLAIVLILQYFGPARELLRQTKDLQAETQELLRNVEATLASQIAQHFEEINNRRFDLAMTTFQNSNLWDRVGRPILEEFISRGLSEPQEEKLIQKMKTDIAFPPPPPPGVLPLNPIAITFPLLFIYTAHDRSSKLEKFLTDYFNGPYGNSTVCNAYRQLAIGYLAQFVDVDLYDLAALILSAPSLGQQDDSPGRVGVNFQILLAKTRQIQPNKVRLLTNDQRFIKALDGKGVLDAYLTHSVNQEGYIDANLYENYPSFRDSPLEKALIEKGAKPPAAVIGGQSD